MTKAELNRDIKRLGAEIYRMSFEDSDKYFEYKDTTARKEFERLFWADKEFEYMNLNSIKLMLRLNVAHRFIPFHQFGLMIKEKHLI
tara:strand:+ start:551 stop:811 length:261 start_codon:yes stop_codon:yes gene_type:complete